MRDAGSHPQVSGSSPPSFLVIVPSIFFFPTFLSSNLACDPSDWRLIHKRLFPSPQFFFFCCGEGWFPGSSFGFLRFSLTPLLDPRLFGSVLPQDHFQPLFWFLEHTPSFSVLPLPLIFYLCCLVFKSFALILFSIFRFPDFFPSPSPNAVGVL